MSNLKVIEEGRRAREIWAKRLGFQIRTLPLNPDGTRPKAEVAETVEAKAGTVKAEVAETAKAEVVETAKATAVKPAAKPAAKPEVKATPANVGVPATKVTAQQG